MDNVIQLFEQKHIKSVASKSESRVATAMTHVLASSSQLYHAVKALSVLFDAIELVIDGIDDTEIQNPLKHTATLSRAALSDVLLKLNQEIQKLLKAANASMPEGRCPTTGAPEQQQCGAGTDPVIC